MLTKLRTSLFGEKIVNIQLDPKDHPIRIVSARSENWGFASRVVTTYSPASAGVFDYSEWSLSPINLKVKKPA